MDLINCRNSCHQHPSHQKSHMHLKIYLDHGLCPKIIILIYLGLLGLAFLLFNIMYTNSLAQVYI